MLADPKWTVYPLSSQLSTIDRSEKDRRPKKRRTNLWSTPPTKQHSTLCMLLASAHVTILREVVSNTPPCCRYTQMIKERVIMRKSANYSAQLIRKPGICTHGHTHTHTHTQLFASTRKITTLHCCNVVYLQHAGI